MNQRFLEGMTYAQQVMTKAHELYRASDGTGRDLFAACLSVAHELVKERRSRLSVVQSLSDIRAQRARQAIGRFARAA